MTVYEYITIGGHDYDVYDEEFDTCITCCNCSEDDGDEDDEFYYRFYTGLMKLANVVKHCSNDNAPDETEIVADWSAMIRQNKPILEEYMYKNWKRDYEDEDDFIYEWIREFHLWGAGYTNEITYKDFVENYMSRMTRVEREDK